MRTLNLGILAHVDAGKTTLTERLLYAAGAIKQIGSVDEGTTQTDYLSLERERGITIRSAVASFAIGEVAVNIIDTPGHPDFIAEVERVLSVLDAGILVVSAVEGVQPQTPLLMRALRRLGVPTLVFLNKIDRAGADTTRVTAELAKHLDLKPIALGTVVDEGTRSARYVHENTLEARAALAAALADADDELLRVLVDTDEVPSLNALRGRLVALVAAQAVQPVISGAAVNGIGVDAVLDAIETILPSADGAIDGELSGRVFKIERSPDAARTAFVRLFAGRLSVRDRIRYGDDAEGRVTHLKVSLPGGSVPSQSAIAGQIGLVEGLTEVRVGDYVGERPAHVPDLQFPPPTMEAVIAPLSAADKPRMRVALTQLAEQDPLINVRQEDESDEVSVSLYGEVQREVIEATLERDFGVQVTFRNISTLHVERPAGPASEHQVIAAKTHTNISGRSSPDSTNPYGATLGMRIEPAPAGSGIEVVVDVNVHLVPLYIFHTVDAFELALASYVRAALRIGLYGWEVTDCHVTVWDSGYPRAGSTARDFRLLTARVVRTALERAGTLVCQPVTRMKLQVPSDSAARLGALLGPLGARVQGQFSTDEVATVVALIPAASMTEVKNRLPGISSGLAVLETEFAGFEPVTGPPPSRRRR